MIKKTISALKKKNSASDLSSFLHGLFEDNYDIQSDSFLVKELESYLFESDDWLLKKTALNGLLCTAKIDNKSYVERAINLLENKSEDEEVRTWALDGLVSVRGDKIVRLLKRIGFDDEDYAFLRYKSLQALLSLNGVTIHELNLRDGYIPPYAEEFTIDGFVKFIKDDIEKFGLAT